jgi:acetoin utilization protein AcuB
MYVKKMMTINPKTVHPEQTVSEVLDLMQEFDIHRLPVVIEGKLVGLITQGVVQENSPSNLSTLSIHEMNYLLSKTKVKDIMIKEVLTTHPEALLEEAADLMYQKDIGCLPVIGDAKVLLGILTTGDILKAFADILGFNQDGLRVSVEVTKNRVGVLAEFAKLFADNNINISHFTNYENEFIFRCSERDKFALEKLLTSKGYKVLSIQ